MAKTYFSELKTSKWQFIAYPESMPNDWLEYLNKTGCKICISPLHDKDVISLGEYQENKKHYDKQNKIVGDIKKAHYHIMVIYDAPTTFNNINKQFVLALNAQTATLQCVGSVRGSYEYYYHANELEKAEYNEKDIIKLNGFNYRDYMSITNKEAFNIRTILTKFVICNDIKSYTQLLHLLMLENLSDYVYVAQNNAQYFSVLINDYKKTLEFDNSIFDKEDTYRSILSNLYVDNNNFEENN